MVITLSLASIKFVLVGDWLHMSLDKCWMVEFISEEGYNCLLALLSSLQSNLEIKLLNRMFFLFILILV